MHIDRKELKRAARASMGAASPSVRLVTLVYILLTTGVSQVVNCVVDNPTTGMLELLQQGIDPVYVLEHVISGGGLTLFVFLSVLLALYTSVMEVGYIGYAMRVSRNRGGGYGDLVGAFSFAGKIIGVVLLVAVYTMLWSLLVSVPLIVIVILVGGGSDLYTALGLGIVLYVVAVVVVVMIALRYALSFYALADDPELGVLDAIRKSKRLMRGNILRYVLLGLSFLGWMLLSGLLTGLGGWLGGWIAPWMGSLLGLLVALPLDVWLVPYMQCAYVNFYDAVSGAVPPVARPDAPGEGPVYRDDPWT